MIQLLILAIASVIVGIALTLYFKVAGTLLAALVVGLSMTVAWAMLGAFGKAIGSLSPPGSTDGARSFDFTIFLLISALALLLFLGLHFAHSYFSQSPIPKNLFLVWVSILTLLLVGLFVQKLRMQSVEYDVNVTVGYDEVNQLNDQSVLAYLVSSKIKEQVSFSSSGGQQEPHHIFGYSYSFSGYRTIRFTPEALEIGPLIGKMRRVDVPAKVSDITLHLDRNRKLDIFFDSQFAGSQTLQD